MANSINVPKNKIEQNVFRMAVVESLSLFFMPSATHEEITDVQYLTENKNFKISTVKQKQKRTKIWQTRKPSICFNAEMQNVTHIGG
jgi:mannose-6-phosphate isomerase class I